MPHSENDSNMSQSMVNGEQPSSKTLSHLQSYPVVHDIISTYESNPYGQKSLSVANAAYDRLAKPVMPYLQRPYSYVAPYVAKADEIADSSLGKVDDTFPIVKQDTEKIKDTVVDYALFPLRVVGQSKNYLLSTYNDEYQKTGGRGLITTAKAVISTELKVTADVFQMVADFLGPKKEAAKQKANEKMNEKMNN